MGFKREKKIFKLVWPEGDENHGLEVRATSCSTGDLIHIMGLVKAVKAAEKDDQSDASLDMIDTLFGAFAKCLVGWNLEDDALTEDGPVTQPVPATKSGLESQDLDFVMSIISAWMGAVSAVGEEEGKGSASGEQFPEASLPMEAL